MKVSNTANGLRFVSGKPPESPPQLAGRETQPRTISPMLFSSIPNRGDGKKLGDRWIFSAINLISGDDEIRSTKLSGVVGC